MAADIPLTPAPAERRQIARTLTFSHDAIPYINWLKVGEMRASLCCDLVATNKPDGSLEVLLYWRSDAEADPLRDAAPDLLACCKLALVNAEVIAENWPEEEGINATLQQDVPAITAAILKAEGRS